MKSKFANHNVLKIKNTFTDERLNIIAMLILWIFGYKWKTSLV